MSDSTELAVADRPIEYADVRAYTIDLLRRRMGESASTPEGRERISTIVASVLQAVGDGLCSKNAADWKRLAVGDLGFAITTIAATGLSPVGAVRELYLFPQGGQLQVRVSPAGLKKLAHRSGQIVRCAVVREGDRFEYALGPNGPMLAHQPVPFGTGQFVGVYCAVYRAVDNALLHVVTMTPGDILVCRSKGRGGSVWSDFPEPMWLKSVLHRALSSGALLLEEGLTHALASVPLAGVEGDTDDLPLSDGAVVRAVSAPPAPGRLARQPAAASLPEPPPELPAEPEPTPEPVARGGGLFGGAS